MTAPHDDFALERATWRRRAEWMPSVVATLLAVLVPLLYWSRLPDPMAVHWGTDNMPDGSAARWVDWLMFAVATAVVTWGPLLAARTPMARSMAKLLVGSAWATSVVFAALRVMTVDANLDAPVWQVAQPLSGGELLGVLIAAALAALAGARIANDRPAHERTVVSVVATAAESAPPSPWEGGVQARMLRTVAAVLVVATIVFSWLIPTPGRYIFAGVMILALLVLTTMTQARVSVDSTGLVVRMGWWGWPVYRARIEDVVDVSVEDVDPWAYGGLGLRSVPGATAVVLRGGEGIRVERASGRALVVAVDDAAVGAGVLAAHLSARGKS